MSPFDRHRAEMARARRNRTVAFWGVILVIGLCLIIPAITLTWS